MGMVQIRHAAWQYAQRHACRKSHWANDLIALRRARAPALQYFTPRNAFGARRNAFGARRNAFGARRNPFTCTSTSKVGSPLVSIVAGNFWLISLSLCKISP